MKRLTEDDLILLRDTFSDLKGNFITDDIDDQTVFPIAAGPWPNHFATAIQVRCKVCNGFAGISPKGWELHLRNPARFIFCGPCFVGLYNMMASKEGQ